MLFCKVSHTPCPLLAVKLVSQWQHHKGNHKRVSSQVNFCHILLRQILISFSRHARVYIFTKNVEHFGSVNRFAVMMYC